jgi:DMSO/TMAO reductase YedYZ heme-binding membrane subunit
MSAAPTVLADVNLAWDTARAAGLVSWFLLAASITWGVLLHTRVLGRRPRPKWLLDLHRFLGGLAVVFVGVHLLGLFLDSYVHFGPAELLVPLASSYRPGAVAWGIAAFYVLVAIEVTSLAMGWLPKRWWHAVHLGSYALFAMATVHLFTAGTDAGNRLVQAAAIAVVIEVVAFVVVRLVAANRRTAARPPRSPATPATPVTAALAAPVSTIASATMPAGPPLWPADDPTERVHAGVR